MRFLQNLDLERFIHTNMQNFVVVALKMWVYSPQNRKKVTFGINLPLRENSGGRQKKLNIGAQLKTSLYAMTP